MSGLVTFTTKIKISLTLIATVFHGLMHTLSVHGVVVEVVMSLL